MKKLLLLLFLIPNLVMAENLMLICEGKATFQLKGFETSYSPDELAVIVGDDFIEWDGKFFSSKPYNYPDENGNSLTESYHKNDKKII
ncbi:hypothetical protein OAH98_03330, partial [Methylophilaceae bacterium]|nr:hypothetical protein [Methylophilaceae bacterium]